MRRPLLLLFLVTLAICESTKVDGEENEELMVVAAESITTNDDNDGEDSSKTLQKRLGRQYQEEDPGGGGRGRAAQSARELVSGESKNNIFCQITVWDLLFLFRNIITRINLVMTNWIASGWDFFVYARVGNSCADLLF